nr:Rpn family recombination-promoting nuclease/putative transposase [uncultured Prevotella sp.]
MKRIEERYISLLTDFGFKRIFGTKPNKDLLINFLNSLFDGFQVIKDVKYLNSEHVGDVFAERKAIFDVYCENERGEKFIVEMQNAYQKYFKDRSLFYSTFPIREQAPKGAEWNFQLEHVYTVALLNFDLEEEAFDKNDINHDVGLLDKKTLKVFNDKLSFKYVEIAKFNKTEEELDTLYDKWLYVLKNLSRLDERPSALKEKVFTKLFEEAEIAKFTPTELKEYEDSLKAYRDVKNSIDTALEKGREEGLAKGLEKGMAKGLEKGREEGMAKGMEKGLAKGLEKGREEGMEKEKLSTARRLLSMGLSEEQVSTATELPLEEIQKLRG